MFSKGWTKIIILLFLVMLVPLLLDSFGIDIIEGAGPTSGGGGKKTAVGKGAAGAAAAAATAAASCVGGQCAADTQANTNKSKIVTSRAEIAALIINMDALKTELTNKNGDKYKKLNGLLGSQPTIIPNAIDALTKEISAANLVKSALTGTASTKANDASIATTKLVTDVNQSITTISDKKTGEEKTVLEQLMTQMTSFNTTLTSNAKIIKDAITILSSNATGKAALATIK